MLWSFLTRDLGVRFPSESISILIRISGSGSVIIRECACVFLSKGYLERSSLRHKETSRKSPSITGNIPAVIMFRFILVSTLLVAASAQYNGYNRDPKTVAIVSEQRYLAGDGQFGAAYDQEDGTNFKEETDADGNRRGSYSYVDPSGQRRTISYVAGKNGFQASGDHLPVAPAAPPAPAHAAPQPHYQPQAQSQPQYNANFDHQGRSYDNQGYEDGQYDPRWNDPSFSQQHSRPAPAPVVTPAPAPVHNYHHQPAPVNTYRHQQPAPVPVAHNYNQVPAAPQPQPQHQDWTTPAPHRFQPPGKLQLNRTPDGFSYTFNKV